ncbi:hypothetical protein [Pedobacter rhodius]|uniref:Natural product n=1 Tax=Pedobacter rhodius TaxID=3004098 RepID=A0ABT4L0M2_9SPHI|nr:hypothetical protein [Pedobacter sp. SJ11]MCZ4223997.1 hypothetical protein [Pedobacter sp. SJ11]
MKNTNQKSLKAITEMVLDTDGKLQGGFTVMSYEANNMILGGEGEGANNCLGGNCVQGCGTNDAKACGGTINTAPGCGVKQESYF